MRLGSREFAPSLPATLAVVPLVALLVWLGTWQLGRAAQSRAQLAAFDTSQAVPAELGAAASLGLPRYARVRATGRYLAARQFLLDNIVHGGVAGYRVLTPFALDGGGLVLVDRGWVPLGRSRAERPAVPVGESPRVIDGRLDELPRPGLELAESSGTAWPRVVSYPQLAALEHALGARLGPRIVLLDRGAADGYVREWRPDGSPSERHLGYAVQWYALAATLLVLYLIVSLRRAVTV